MAASTGCSRTSTRPQATRVAATRVRGDHGAPPVPHAVRDARAVQLQAAHYFLGKAAYPPYPYEWVRARTRTWWAFCLDVVVTRALLEKRDLAAWCWRRRVLRLRPQQNSQLYSTRAPGGRAGRAPAGRRARGAAPGASSIVVRAFDTGPTASVEPSRGGVERRQLDDGDSRRGSMGTPAPARSATARTPGATSTSTSRRAWRCRRTGRQTLHVRIRRGTFRWRAGLRDLDKASFGGSTPSREELNWQNSPSARQLDGADAGYDPSKSSCRRAAGYRQRGAQRR
jgi:hypothetical protein